MSWQSASSLLRSAEDLRETRSRCDVAPACPHAAETRRATATHELGTVLLSVASDL